MRAAWRYALWIATAAVSIASLLPVTVPGIRIDLLEREAKEMANGPKGTR